MYDAAFPSPSFEPRLLIAEAATVYAVAAQRLSHIRALLILRRAASHGLTVLLLVISLAGFVEIGHLVSDAASPATSTRSTAASTAPKHAAAAAAPNTMASQKASASAPAALSASTPTHIQIPAINLDAAIDTVGLNDDGSLQVPYREDAGWYSGSPTPGEIGPAVIDGHVDSVYGIAVFWYLKNLHPGNKIIINREDGSVVNFKIDKIATYDQHNFPTKEVYGNINYPGLRLITCDGTFDYATRHYSNNLVVYARAVL